MADSPSLKTFLELQKKGILPKVLDPRVSTVPSKKIREDTEQAKREMLSAGIDVVPKGLSTIPVSNLLNQQIAIDSEFKPLSEDIQSIIENQRRMQQGQKGTRGAALESTEGVSPNINIAPTSEIGDKFAGIDQSDTGVGSDKQQQLEQEEKNVESILEEERRMQQGQKSLVEETENPTATLFKEAMAEIEDLYGDSDKPKGRKTIDDYKADFAKATGIDISGEPDNRSALMALGLSLMQNRAGKGFDLSKILTDVGAAGERALPKFEAARKEARAGQIAAGKFALQEQKADTLAELATAKEKRKALMEVSKQFRDFKNKQQLEYLKHQNNMQIKLLENNMKPIDAKGKVTTQTLEGNNFLKVDTAFVTGSRNRVFLAPVQQAEKHANMYVNVLEANNSITEMQNILKSVGEKGGSTAFSLLATRVKDFLKPLGIGDTDYSKGIDEIVKQDISAEKKVTAIQQRLISQYKKFLTKETGNGVSEGDIKRLEALVAKINLTQPLSSNINRLEELRTIFAAPQRALESQFTAFSKRENFRNDEEYNKTMAIIEKAISSGTDDTYNFNVGSTGEVTIDLRVQ
jgi:hypothetical protein